MKKRIVAVLGFSLAASAILFAADRVTLTGKVTDTAGKPLPRATVLVYQAGVKKGYSIFCPSCYTDCGKRALTDANGAFTLDRLSPDLWFNLLVVRDGYTPVFVRRADPAKGPADTAVLAERKPVVEPSRAVRGRVVDPQGTPVRDAVVTPRGVATAHSAAYGEIPGLDPITVTNEKGEFEIAYAKPATKMALMVEPRAMAPKFVTLRTGAERQTVTVNDGAVVRGRLLMNGKPIGGVEIALNPREPWAGGADLQMFGSLYSGVRIGTQEDGSFAITSVPAPEQWNVYATMDSIASLGAVEPVRIATARDGEEINVGDLVIKPGYRLRGNVVLRDAKPIPEGMRVLLSSGATRDIQTSSLAPDGSFEFRGLTAGKYSLTPSVKGYEQPPITTAVEHDVDGLTINLHPVGGSSPQR